VQFEIFLKTENYLYLTRVSTFKKKANDPRSRFEKNKVRHKDVIDGG